MLAVVEVDAVVEGVDAEAAEAGIVVEGEAATAGVAEARTAGAAARTGAGELVALATQGVLGAQQAGQCVPVAARVSLLDTASRPPVRWDVDLCRQEAGPSPINVLPAASIEALAAMDLATAVWAMAGSATAAWDSAGSEASAFWDWATA